MIWVLWARSGWVCSKKKDPFYVYEKKWALNGKIMFPGIFFCLYVGREEREAGDDHEATKGTTADGLTSPQGTMRVVGWHDGLGAARASGGDPGRRGGGTPEGAPGAEPLGNMLPFEQIIPVIMITIRKQEGAAALSRCCNFDLVTTTHIFGIQTLPIEKKQPQNIISFQILTPMFTTAMITKAASTSTDIICIVIVKKNATTTTTNTAQPQKDHKTISTTRRQRQREKRPEKYITTKTTKPLKKQQKYTKKHSGEVRSRGQHPRPAARGPRCGCG